MQWPSSLPASPLRSNPTSRTVKSGLATVSESGYAYAAGTGPDTATGKVLIDAQTLIEAHPSFPTKEVFSNKDKKTTLIVYYDPEY